MSPANANLVQPEVQSIRPTIPDRLEDLGITRSLVSDLILRYLWLHGSGTLTTLNERLKLSFPVLETMFHQFRQQHILEVKGMLGNDYAFSLTGGGRTLATARNEVCQYVGPAPLGSTRIFRRSSTNLRAARISSSVTRTIRSTSCRTTGNVNSPGLGARSPSAMVSGRASCRE